MFNFNFQQNDVKHVIKSSSYTNKDPNRKGAVGSKKYVKNQPKQARTSQAAPVFNFSGLRQVTNLYGVVVCVNYSDFFKHSLESARGQFKKIFVITTPEDKHTISLCKNYDFAEVIETDIFYKDGRKFDKGAGINLGLNKVPTDQANWCLIFDADIVFPNYMSKYLSSKALDSTVLFGAPRHFIRNPEAWKDYVAENKHISSLSEVYNPGVTPIGYFQLFNSQNLLLTKIRYPEEHNDASSSDLVFTRHFNTRTTLKHISVIHLGDDGKNWKGRVTPSFDSKVEKEAKALKTKKSRGGSTGVGSNPKNRTLRQLKQLERDSTIPIFSKQVVSTDGIIKSPDLAIMTCYFNPHNNKNIYTNYLHFKNHIEAFADLYTVELVMDGEEPKLGQASDRLVHVHGDRKKHSMFQKECLLNTLAKHVLSVSNCKYISWMDADILFTDKDWVYKSINLLQDTLIIQPFSGCTMLNHEMVMQNEYGRDSRHISSMNYWQWMGKPSTWNIGYVGEFNTPGSTKSGLGWLACREFFEQIGLEWRGFIGNGDAVMVGAFTQSNPWWLVHYNKVYGDGAFVQHWHKWGERVNDLSKSLGKTNTVGGINGCVFHMNHGTMKNRRYVERNKLIIDVGCDVMTDVELGDNGLMHFTEVGQKKDLHNIVHNYFCSRQEDEFINDYSLLTTDMLLAS